METFARLDSLWKELDWKEAGDNNSRPCKMKILTSIS